jgi:hypothetical protein
MMHLRSPSTDTFTLICNTLQPAALQDSRDAIGRHVGYPSSCLNLSDNYPKQTQTNTVIVQQIKVDRVGFEPTTSAMPGF